jgi:CheY-specific phosphatase CheX
VFEDIQNIAASVTTHIFETMFFTFLEPQGEEPNKDPSSVKNTMPFLRGEIEFEGKYSGRLKLYLPMELAKIMALNFMGSEGDVSDPQAMDMVNELCNMVCGNLFAQLDKKTVFNLGIPQTHIISNKEMEKDVHTPGIKINFDTEGYPIKLNIEIDS